MNTTEDRIRAAARAAADTVPPDGVPPLRLPARPPRRAWSFGSAWTRRLAPAAAAVAVVVIVLVAVTVGRAGRDSAAAPASGRSAPQTIASYVSSGQVPPYYVEVNASGTDAVVRATATGRTLSTTRLPTAGDLVVEVSAAADDRTFVLAERPRAGTRSGGLTFRRLRLSVAGRMESLSTLPASVPAGQTLLGFALSPDADKLAVAVAPGHDEEEIRVYTLATGAVRTWSATSAGVGFFVDDPTYLSWTRDERTLAFGWNGAGTRLISPDASSGNLEEASRPGFAGSGQGWACMESAVITPDGKTFVCGARIRRGVSVSNDQIGFAEYAAAGGQLEHVFGQRLAGPLGPVVGWQNASGSVLIGGFQSSANSARLTVGVVTSSRFLPLPGSPDLLFMSIAW